MKSFYRLL